MNVEFRVIHHNNDFLSIRMRPIEKVCQNPKEIAI